MVITTVVPENSRLLQDIADTLARVKKIVVVTGAGISTNCGIPDFRSKDGLYSLIDSAYNRRLSCSSEPLNASHIKGKDLFDSRLWQDELSTSVFYTFVASLRQKIIKDVKGTTATHKFIRSLKDKRKLVRCYTQNIDGLETRENLCSDLARGRGNRGRFTKKSMQVVGGKHHHTPGGCLDGGCEVVRLHGDLDALRCTLCRKTSSWEDGKSERLFLEGRAPVCQNCASEDKYRRDRGKRGTTIGTLRPNIVLYGEEHPLIDLISPIVTHDLGLAPDVLLILGTSLKVHGFKKIVKEFAKSVHARKNGKVIFVNLSPPAESVWKDAIDYWIDMDCDAWVQDIQRRRADMFLQQKPLDWNVTKVDVDGNIKNFEAHSQDDGIKDKENRMLPEPALLNKIPDVTCGRGTIEEARRPPQTPQCNNRVTKILGERQLPTPPYTQHRATCGNVDLSRTLAQHDLGTPSKRRKLTDILIYCDSEEDESIVPRPASNGGEESLSDSIMVAGPNPASSAALTLKRRRVT